MNAPNVLITSAGRRVALVRAFRQALSGVGAVLACDSSELSSASREADAHFLSPAATSAHFLPFMLDLCEREKVGLIVPTIDTELPIWAEAQRHFRSRGIEVLVSDSATVEIAGDKKLTNEFFQHNGVPTVRQASPHEVSEDSKSWNFPVVAKPRRGSSAMGLSYPSTVEEVRALPDDYVVEELAPGVEFTMDVYLGLEGRSSIVVPRLRIETRAGEVSKSVTRHVPDLQSLTSKICRDLPGARGVLTVQAFCNPRNPNIDIRFIEINARFAGGFPLTYAAGGNFPGWLLSELRGERVSPELHEWKADLLMLRFDDAVFVENYSPGHDD